MAHSPFALLVSRLLTAMRFPVSLAFLESATRRCVAVSMRFKSFFVRGNSNYRTQLYTAYLVFLFSNSLDLPCRWLFPVIRS